MNKKQLYTAPEADLLVVRFEENILSYGPNGVEKSKDRNGESEGFFFS